MNKINYGFDAPTFMKQALGGGLGLCLAGFAVLRMTNGGLIFQILSWLCWIVGGLFLLMFGILVVYGLKGKYRMRDFIIGKINWTGREQVLDVGVGRGLLMNAAAQKLTTGKSTGIDLWDADDLTGNSRENALANAALEGVADRVAVLDMDAQRLEFPDETFDVVLSMLCIHNIDEPGGIEKACFEIARVLKPGGVALIADYLPTGGYAAAFAKAGLTVRSSKSYFGIALGLTWMAEAVKK